MDGFGFLGILRRCGCLTLHPHGGGPGLRRVEMDVKHTVLRWPGPPTQKNKIIMLRYKKYKSTRPGTTKDQWYVRLVSEMVEFDEFIEHMANHHCAFSEATIRGVLIEMETCLRELLLEGKAVRLDDLGIFKIGAQSQGSPSAKDCTAENVVGLHVNWYLGKRFRAANLMADAKIREAGKYAVDDEVDPERTDNNGAPVVTGEQPQA